MIKVIYGQYDISQLVTQVEWSGDTQQAARTCNITLTNTKDGINKLLTFQHAASVSFSYNNVKLFQGYVFGINSKTGGEVVLTCYDSNIYLVKNSDTIKFVNKKASEIVKHLANLYKIPIGTIHDTGYVIPKHIFNEQTLYDMMVTALTTTKKHNGRRFFITNELGKLTLRERSKPATRYVIETGANLINAEVNSSIEDLRNRVKVIGGDDKKPITVTVSDSSSMKKYGLMQHVERNFDDKMTKAKLQSLAKSLLKQMNKVQTDITIEAAGITSAIAGAAIDVKNKLTGLSSTYYISSDTHTFTPGVYTMTLQVSKDDILPTMDYEE